MYKTALVVSEVGEGSHKDQLNPSCEKGCCQNAQIIEEMFSSKKRKWLENPQVSCHGQVS